MNPPYYIVPLIEEFRRLDPDDPQAKVLSRKIAANVGDLASLRLLLGIDPPQFAKFYPDMEVTSPSTFDTIDSFLDKFGKDMPAMGYVPEEPAEYALPEEEDTTEPPQSTPQDYGLSRLIKEKRYSEAMKFIEHQNLNNPQKSIYFAHQMRFLKKLMALEKFKHK